jgi:hypothetical protein
MTPPRTALQSPYYCAETEELSFGHVPHHVQDVACVWSCNTLAKENARSSAKALGKGISNGLSACVCVPALVTIDSALVPLNVPMAVVSQNWFPSPSVRAGSLGEHWGTRRVVYCPPFTNYGKHNAHGCWESVCLFFDRSAHVHICKVSRYVRQSEPHDAPRTGDVGTVSCIV